MPPGPPEGIEQGWLQRLGLSRWASGPLHGIATLSVAESFAPACAGAAQLPPAGVPGGRRGLEKGGEPGQPGLQVHEEHGAPAPLGVQGESRAALAGVPHLTICSAHTRMFVVWCEWMNNE
eukprot:scaffold55108_cov35-Prasinocladus_malaysianus.AAC.1